MTTRKPSFFERLTGSIKMTDDDLDFPKVSHKRSIFNDTYDEVYDDDVQSSPISRNLSIESDEGYGEELVSEEIAELSVDVYHDDENIYIQTMTAGVKKSDLEITLSREQVTVRGTREPSDAAYDANHVISELYWGNFERIVELPDEVDIEKAKAHETHGLVTLILPKFDKKRQTTLKVE
jgi:HSP20 family molecular chaperone IbpA